MQFVPTVLSSAERDARERVRAWLVKAVPAERRTMLGMAGVGGHDPAFSKELAAEGLLGLALPTALGGHGASPVQRLLVTEELLTAQAPVSAHWFADRQTAPMIASHGTANQQARFLPPILAGELFFSIGMSEPDSGSDLASVKTVATRVEGGWSVTGTKLWTSWGQLNDWFVVLCRTSPAEKKHEGLSQLLVDLRAPGVTIRPITTLDGEQDFAEVVLDQVFVPGDLLLGQEGGGWAQVTGELGFERGGPDRYLSAWDLFAWLVEQAPPGSAETIGRLTARYRVVRELALAAARSLECGGAPVTEAAVTKDLGTVLEQETVEAVRQWVGPELDPQSGDRRDQLLARAVLTAPTFTLRGGTTEVLRTLIARSVTRSRPRNSADLLTQTVDDILSKHRDTPAGAWRALTQAGITFVGLPEAVGGSGGALADAAGVLMRAGASGVALPLAETGLLAGWALAQAGVDLPAGPLTVAVDHDLVLEGDVLRGQARRVPFARDAALIIAVVGDRLVAAVPTAVHPGEAINGEPRDTARFDRVRPAVSVLTHCQNADLSDRGAATRVLLIAGALRTVLRLSVEHTSTREQFGQPLIRFQAVEHQVAILAEQVARAEMAAELAVRWLEGVTDRTDLAVATLTAREAATVGAKLAHQVHGAIGMAQEYDLQLFTRSLWTWRDEFGTERAWALALGDATAAESGGLWAWLSR